MRFVVALVAVSLLAGGARAAPRVHSEHASGLGVDATLSYVRLRYGVYYVRLVVERNGQRVYDKRVQPYSAGTRLNQPLGVEFSPGSSLAVDDLNFDGEPEIVVDFWTGGAHCCVWSRIYRWDGATYASAVHWWGDTGYEIDDLSGGPSFVTGDDRFAYAFSSYAGSAFPLQVWALAGSRLVNVTSRYRPLIRRDDAELWREYASARKDHGELRGVLAAWLADECRLGRGKRSLAWLRRHAYLFRNEPSLFVGSNAKFLRALPNQLRRWGYPC
jgi:hypothetical protein